MGASQSINDQSALAALRGELAEVQLPQIVRGRRALILFDGPVGSAKKTALKQLAASFDPCHYAVHCTGYDRREASDGHWLARFWRQLPSAGNTSIFFRSWYRRVLDDRLFGRTDEATVLRAFDEINEFEAQQLDYGTVLVKLYFEVNAEVQEQRLAERAANSWWREARRDDPIMVADPAYASALEDLKAHSDTRWSPWRMIDGNDEQAAAIAALTAIRDVWRAAIPAEPAARILGSAA